MYLLGAFNPKVDKLIDKIKSKIGNKNILKTIVMLSFIIMYIDFILTGFALKCFQTRKIKEYNIDVANKEEVTERYNKIYGNEAVSKFVYKFWGDKKMIRTFPNLKVQDKNGNIIYFDTLVPDVQPYYFKVYEK